MLVVALAAFVLVIVPGPAVIYILTRSVSQGRTAGLVSAVGVNLGSAVHVLFAAAGLSVILAQSAVLFSLVKWAGVAYLVWIGIQTLRAPESDFVAGGAEPTSLRRIFIQGILVNILNPKVAMFFLAFLPQFIDPNATHAGFQAFVLGMILVAIGLVSDSVYALLGGTIGNLFRRRPGAARITKRAAGVTYFALAGISALSGSRS